MDVGNGSLLSVVIPLIMGALGSGILSAVLLRASRDKLRETFVTREEFNTYKETSAAELKLLVERFTEPLEQIAERLEAVAAAQARQAITQAQQGTDISWVRKSLERGS